MDDIIGDDSLLKIAAAKKHNRTVQPSRWNSVIDWFDQCKQTNTTSMLKHTGGSKTKHYLFWWKNGDIVLVDDPGFLLDGCGVWLLLEFLAGHPEQQVLLTVFGAQKLTENVTAFHGPHHLLKAACPGDHLIQGGVSGRREGGVEGEHEKKKSTSTPNIKMEGPPGVWSRPSGHNTFIDQPGMCLNQINQHTVSSLL